MNPIRPGMLYTIGFGVLAAGIAAGFYCGWTYRGSQLPAPSAPAPAAAAAPAVRNGFLGRPLVSGRVVSVHGSSIVVHDQATDTDVRVVLGPGASVTRSQTVTIKPSALSTSDNLVVFGQAQSDGSVLASSVAVTGSPGFRIVQPAPS